jgi:ribonuclease HII
MEDIVLNKNKTFLHPYQNINKVEIGIDEAGRGCLFGRVYIAGVILPHNIQELCDEEDIVIKDSKKLNKKARDKARIFIENNALDYSVIYKDNEFIDEYNILQATLLGMHDVVDGLKISPDKILVDGDKFIRYYDSDGKEIEHQCVIEGDNTYMSIAAASILAKTYKDEFIKRIVEEEPDLAKYDLVNNSGYGTKTHLDAIKTYGISKYHRKTFGICKEYSSTSI